MDRKVLGPRSGLPRAGLPSGKGIDAVIFWIAFALAALFSIAEVGFVATYVPVMLYTYAKAGMDPSWLLAFGESLGPLGIVAVLTVLDLAIFAACVWGARRYWIGLLFISPLFYLLIAFVMFAAGFAGLPTLLH